MPYNTRDPNFNPTTEMYRSIGGAPDLGTIGAGLKGAAGGAISGAGVGMMVGNVPGAAIGAAVGATVGAALEVSKKLIATWKQLNVATRTMLETYAKFNPILRQLNRRWQRLDKEINKLWANTLQPTLTKWSEWSIRFEKEWTQVKIEWFKAFKPLIDILHQIVVGLSPHIIALSRALALVTRAIVSAQALILSVSKRIVSILNITAHLPTATIAGVGKVVRVLGGGKASGGKVDADTSYVVGETGPEIFTPIQPGKITPTSPSKRSASDKGITVNVAVNDSAELTTQFMKACDKVRNKLRHTEANAMLAKIRLHAQGVYI